MRNLILFSIMLVMVASCNRRPSGVLNNKDMTDLIVDMRLADSYAYREGYTPGDSTLPRLHMQVLKDHGVSEKDYHASLDWYGRNLDEYAKLYEKVEYVLNKKQGLMVPDEALLTQMESMWPSSPMLMISPLSPSRDIRFSIEPEGVSGGDRLTWSMRTLRNVSMDIYFGVDYADGSATYVKRNTQGGRNVKVMLQTDTAQSVKRIYGYATIGGNERLPVWLDSIMLVKEPYNRDEYSMIRTQGLYLKPEVRRARYKREREMRDSIAREKAIVPAGLGTAAPSNPMIPRHYVP